MNVRRHLPHEQFPFEARWVEGTPGPRRRPTSERLPLPTAAVVGHFAAVAAAAADT